MKYNCKECGTDFDSVIARLEAGVKGEIIRITNNLEKPCCPDCMKNALNEVAKVVANLH